MFFYLLFRRYRSVPYEESKINTIKNLVNLTNLMKNPSKLRVVAALRKRIKIGKK